MKALNNKLSEELYTIMGLFDSETLNNSEKYIVKYFSTFDHWLNEEEAKEQILFYQNALEEGDTIKSQQYYKYHDKILEFYLDLYDKTIVYGMLSAEYSGTRVGIKFDNIEEYRTHVLLSIREQLFLTIVLPEFYSVIKGNFDLTHLLYTLKSKPEGFKNITSIIKSHGLFII